MSLSPRQKRIASRLVESPTRGVWATALHYLTWPFQKAGAWLHKHHKIKDYLLLAIPAIGVALVLLLIAIFMFAGAGCAVGRTASGQTVYGVELESAPESAAELAAFGSAFLPPPWNLLVGGAATLLLGGTGATVAAQRKAKQREDAAWDEAEARTAARYTPPPGYRLVTESIS